MKISSVAPVLKEKDMHLYNKQGYFIFRNFISSEICKKIKEHAEDNYAEKPDYPITLNIHRKDKLFFKIISDKNIIKIMRFFQGSDIDALTDQMIYKKRNSKYVNQAWTIHQDNSYPKADHGHYTILHLFLDDSTPDNGGLVFYEGSHVEPILDYKNRVSHKENKQRNGKTRPGQTLIPNEAKRIKEKYKKIEINEKSGTLCLMHGHLVHESKPNNSKSKDRATYSMAYLNRNSKIKNEGKVSKKVRVRLY